MSSGRQTVRGDWLVSRTMPEKAYAEQWDIAGLEESLKTDLALDLPVREWAAEEGVDQDVMRERLSEKSDAMMEEKTAALTGNPRIRARRPMQPPMECATR